MGWSGLSHELIAPLLRFLGPREVHCAAFTEKLIAEGQAAVPPSGEHRVFIRSDGTGRINGAILQSRSGLYYPVFDETCCQVEKGAIGLMRRHSRKLYSLMGRSDDVRALEDGLGNGPLQSVDYHLMSQEIAPPEIPLPRLPSDLEIVHSTIADARRLASLQREYEIEEVLLPGNTFDRAASLNHLRAALRTQVIIHALSGGKPVAKAGTNARGLFFDQIGGVFTTPGLRSRGIGTALMIRLLALIAAESKNATLFVKMDNYPALAMYRTLGFAITDEFRISYYR